MQTISPASPAKRQPMITSNVLDSSLANQGGRPRRFAGLRRLPVHGLLRAVAWAAVAAPLIASGASGDVTDPGFNATAYACGTSCNRVFFTTEETAATCQSLFVLSECNQSIQAYVFESDAYWGTICNCFTNGANDPAIWTIDGNNLGLKIEGHGVDDSCFGFADITPADRWEDVQEGTLTVSVHNASGGKSGPLAVKVSKAGCGCESSPASASAFNGSAAASFGIGRGAFGKFIGSISMKESAPTNLLCTPLCLAYKFGTNMGCEVVTNCTGIRQVKAPEGLANVVTNSAFKYVVQFYPLSALGAKYTNADCTGCYAVSGPPLMTNTVENLDGATSTNRLRITDGYGAVSDFEFKTNGWELVKGQGLIKEYKTTTWSNTNTVQLVSTEKRDQAGTLVSCSSTKLQVFTFGTREVEKVSGAGSAALTNTFSYYTSGPGSGLLQQVTSADGTWQVFEYDPKAKRASNILSGFQNQGPTNDTSLCRWTQHSYATNDPGDDGHGAFTTPRRTVEYVLGHEVARSYAIITPYEQRRIQCVTAGASVAATDNLVTVAKWYSSGVDMNRLKSIERPDGTMDIFTYGFSSSGTSYRTNIVRSGVPDVYKTNIVDGTKSVTVLGAYGQLISKTTTDIASVLLTASESYSDFDSFNRPRRVTFIDGTSTWSDYGCCGPITQSNREGTYLTNFLDAARRVAAVKQNGITQTNVLDPDGRVLQRVRVGSDGSQILQATNGYDLSGRLVLTRDALGNPTTYGEGITSYQRTQTTTYPDGSTRVELYYRNGQLAKVTGTAVRPVRYDYGVEQDGGAWRTFTKEITLDAGGSDTSEWTKSYQDMAGRAYKTVYSDGSYRQIAYNAKGQRSKEVDPDGVTTLFDYNTRGELEYTATDVDRNGVMDLSGTDRVRRTTRLITTNALANVAQTKTYVLGTNNSAVTTLISVTEQSTDGLRTWSTTFGATNFSQTYLTGGGSRFVTNVAPDGSTVLNSYYNGLPTSFLRKDSQGNQLGKSTFSYDSHGRKASVLDARNGSTLLGYDNADRVTSMTTPVPGNGQGSQTTLSAYDWAGRLLRSTLADGTTVSNAYSFKGELLTNWGSRTYPVAYTYDPQSRRKTMITWTNFASRTGAATTTWNYDASRGLLLTKVYSDGRGTTNTYTPAGRLRTRTWARGVVTTYQTNSAGEAYALTYSDATPALTNFFDRLGRITNVIDGTGSRVLTYTDTGALQTERNVAGTLAGLSISNSYDALWRRKSLDYRTNNGAAVLSYSYAYDGASRLTNVSDGVYSAGYSYVANSPLVSQVAFRSNSTTRMTTSKSYDYLNRLLSTSSTNSTAGVLASFAYDYSDANQRNRILMADGSYWVYEYDRLGQLTSGKRYWSDGTPVAGQQFEYAFDDIGNRLSTKAGGDETGAALRTASYTANALNQYTARDVPGAVDVLGIAHASASVTVNGQSPYRRGEYFRKELATNNAAAAVWMAVTNIASLSGTNQTNVGNLFLPRTAESFAYDADGNLTNDGRFRYVWDAENRMTLVESQATAPTASKRKVTFEYDDGGRMTRRVEYDGSSGSYVQTSDTRFSRDG